MAGFGASDCDCDAHLAVFDQPPSLAAFRDRLRARSADHAPVRRVDGTAVGEEEA
jgi:Uri superfamily endonuclease